MNTVLEQATSELRWVPCRNPFVSLITGETHRPPVLQQKCIITTYVDMLPRKQVFEWRDVPTVEEEK